MPPILPPSENLLKSILESNATYAKAFSQSDPVLLAKLAKGQSPRICWLGCSDSRVSAELSTGVAPGSIFVHRNVAQCFKDDDSSALAALAYAVHQLKVEAIIVCGHTGCGGVRAGMIAATEELAHDGSPLPPMTESDKVISNWIAPIKSLALDQLAESSRNCSHSSHPPPDPLSSQSLATLTDRHVAETVRLVSQSQIVKDAWAMGMELSVHGWIYNIADATLKDLGIGLRGDGIPAFTVLSRPSSVASSENGEESGEEEEEDSENDSEGYESEEIAAAISKLRLEKAEKKRQALSDLVVT